MVMKTSEEPGVFYTVRSGRRQQNLREQHGSAAWVHGHIEERAS